jgi:hypothetical protein
MILEISVSLLPLTPSLPTRFKSPKRSSKIWKKRFIMNCYTFILLSSTRIFRTPHGHTLTTDSHYSLIIKAVQDFSFMYWVVVLIMFRTIQLYGSGLLSIFESTFFCFSLSVAMGKVVQIVPYSLLLSWNLSTFWQVLALYPFILEWDFTLAPP